MAKYVPNMLSILRIILSVLLIPLYPVDYIFIIVYLTIGLTDVLDGLIARKFGYESELGAKLDSIADLVFYSIYVFLFLKLFSSAFDSILQVILILIISIRMINMIVTKLKYKKIVFVHTIANKITGLLVFLAPMVLLNVNHAVSIKVMFAIALVAAIEELLISIKYPKPDLNRKSILFK
jgi:CDP-diacylglycerol--glycerol-3-phosphate 3-phosphatidyltransferase